MSKLPAFQFYPADWRKDPGVQSLSFHDRGVWFEILCLMHESEQRGKLLLGGQPMPDAALARLLGLDKQNLTNTLNTLISYGVASRCDKSGALMSRRMVRDEESRNKSKEAGHLGGNPKLTTNYNMPGFLYVAKRHSDGHYKIGIASNLKGRMYKLNYTHKGMDLIESFAVENMGKSEKEAHDLLADKRVIGEWFVLNDSDLTKLRQSLKGKTRDEAKGEVRASSSSSSSITISNMCINARDITCSFFGISEMKNFKAFREITEALMLLDEQQKISYYIQQLEQYKLFKRTSGQQKCNYSTWLFGEISEERHLDNGHWCKQDYQSLNKQNNGSVKKSYVQSGATPSIRSGNVKDFGEIKL